MTQSFARAVVPLLLLACAAPARAHEFWLTPSRYVAGAGDTLDVRAFVGTGFRGEARPYAPTRVLRFEARTSMTLDLAPLGTNGDLRFARFVMPDDGGALVVYRSNFVPIELPAAEFDRYLVLEGLDGPHAARERQGAAAGPGRERYARCGKTWVAGRDHARATRVAGLPLEIVPLADPTAPGPLNVRVLFRGKPLAGALLRAWRQPLGAGVVPRDAASRDSVGPTLEARTSGRGEASLMLDGAGEWLISTAHMIPSEDRAAADWESQWSSITFARATRPR